MTRNRLAFAALVLLAGCASKPVDPAVRAAAEEPLICHGTEQCATMWKRAQYWVSVNSGYKIQTATDTVIETYNAATYSTTWAYVLRKEPLANGEERIWVRPSCGSVGLCKDSPYLMIVQAKYYIGYPQ